MSVRQEDAARHVLVVTGPERERLYRRFAALFAGRGDVEVVKDRRVAQRRRTTVSAQERERRGGDRRQAEPEWVVPPA